MPQTRYRYLSRLGFKVLGFTVQGFGLGAFEFTTLEIWALGFGAFGAYLENSIKTMYTSIMPRIPLQSKNLLVGYHKKTKN